MMTLVYRVKWNPWRAHDLELGVSEVTKSSAKQLVLKTTGAAFDWKTRVHPGFVYESAEDAWIGAIGAISKDLSIAEEQVRILSDHRTHMNMELMGLRKLRDAE